MDFELLFSIVGLISMLGWLLLLLSPWMPRYSDLIAGLLLPFILSLSYAVILVCYPAQNGGGFGSFSQVTQLFSSSNVLMAGWIHYLAFDLVVGAWICRDGRNNNFSFWFVAPCLPFTFMIGPVGFLLYLIIRTVKLRSFQISNV